MYQNFVVGLLSQLQHILGLADQRAHVSTFECVRLCSEGKIVHVNCNLPPSSTVKRTGGRHKLLKLSKLYDGLHVHHQGLSKIMSTREAYTSSYLQKVHTYAKSFFLRSFPSIALRIPTVHNFTRD